MDLVRSTPLRCVTHPTKMLSAAESAYDSAILRGRNPRAVIQFIIDTPDYSWMVSPEILTESKEVLNQTKLKLKQEWAEWG